MIQFGIDNLLLQNPSWKSQNIALVTNHAATTNQLIPTRKALIENGFNIIQLFSPEHGLDVTGADGNFIHDGTDTLTNLPIISLYCNKLQPSAEDLQNIDIVLFDIPDIGCRYYTYLWTMTHVLEACAKHKKQLIILDRPNPISGIIDLAEGPLLDEKHCSSFIGRWAMPLRHSCTLGELALYFNTTKQLHCKLQIIQCSNWNRNQFQPNWNIDFVPTSPAIKNANAALLYPGLGLLEATNISEGRGTNQSFEIAGATWFNATTVCTLFNQIQDDIVLKEIQFTPTHSKYTNEVCSGVQFNIQNTATYQPVYTALLFIKLVKDMHPTQFKWMPYPTHVNPTGTQHLDKLLGIQNSEAIFNLPFQQFLQQIQQITKVQNWQNEIASYLLY
jgi:uncharacterized protein YbbC (DUF1343 family)